MFQAIFPVLGKDSDNRLFLSFLPPRNLSQEKLQKLKLNQFVQRLKVPCSPFMYEVWRLLPYGQGDYKGHQESVYFHHVADDGRPGRPETATGA